MLHSIKNKLKQHYRIISIVCAISIIFTFTILLNPKKESDSQTNDAQKAPSIDINIHSEATFPQLMYNLLLPEKAIKPEDKAVQDAVRQMLTYTEESEAFEVNNFSVTTRNFLLHDNSFVRLVEYHGKDQNSQFEVHYFLQYVDVNKDTLFSDINTAFINEDIRAHVYETTHGIFAFVENNHYTTTDILTGLKYTMHSLSNYKITKKTIISEENAAPVRTSYSHPAALKVENDTIYAYTPDLPNEAVFKFNPVRLRFELDTTLWDQADINYELPGVLIGLTNLNGDIRTLYIYKKDGRIQVDEIKDKILFERDNHLFLLEYYRYFEATYNHQRYVADSQLEIDKLRTRSVNDDSDFKINIEFDEPSEPYLSVRSAKEIPFFVGEDYISYLRVESATGGGLMSYGEGSMHYNTFKQLEQFTYLNGTLSPQFKEKTLADIMYGTKAKSLYESSLSSIPKNEKDYLDFYQLFIKRNLGNWSAVLPIMEKSTHPSDGNIGINVKRVLPFENNLPDKIAPSDTDFEIPSAWGFTPIKDILKIPGTNIMIAQYDFYFGVGLIPDLLTDVKYDVKIPIESSEFIVSIDYLTKNSKDDWHKVVDSLK